MLHLPVSGFVILRLFLVLLGSLLTLAILERRFQALTRFLNEKSTALNLAVARVAVAATLLWKIRFHDILFSTSLDPALRVPFRIWGSLATRLIAPPALMTAIYGIFLLSAFLMLIGLFGRAASAVTAISAVYLISFLFLYGKVDHSYHHLVFFSFLCALFPSTDTLSLDAVLAASRDADAGRLRRTQAALAYGDAMRSMWVFVGVAYYFPGLWKFSRSWLHWLSGNALHDYIALAGELRPWTPLQLWLLRHPLQMSLASALVVLFELGFIFVILFPRWRPFAGLLGLAFHTATYLVLGIAFVSLQSCYVIFFDWTAIFSWIRREFSLGTGYKRVSSSRACVTTGSSPIVLALPLAGLGFMTILGLFHVIDTWPLSCFPTFDGPTSDTVTQLSVQTLGAGNQAQDWNLSSDPKLRAVYQDWYWLANQVTVPGIATRPKAAAVVNLWLRYHPELHVRDVVVSQDTYQMRPLEGNRVRVARKETWEFAF